jgi:drug/metabolite transporter (DMT)-like permease
MNQIGRFVSAIAVVFAALWPAIALAQAAPPQPQPFKQSPPVWLGYLVIFVLLAMVVSVSLMPSKRSHQD